MLLLAFSGRQGRKGKIMDMAEQAKRIIDEAREQLQSRYPECATCKHRGEKHGMNCLECCPVERAMSHTANSVNHMTSETENNNGKE